MLKQACEELFAPGTGLYFSKASGLYRTAAWGNPDQPDFYNQILIGHTRLEPEQLLDLVLKTEAELGRVRAEKWAARTIDIDIIFYADQVISTPRLQVPHPLLQERAFVLVPLAETAPDFVHPVFGKTVTGLLQLCPDRLSVEKVIQHVPAE